MLQFIIECLAFQLLFLVVYDFFLKKETFFQWNRFYLIGTFIVSLVLPWIRIEALKTTVSQDFISYPAFMWQLDGVTVGQEAIEISWWEILSTQEIIFGLGALLAAFWFGYKLLQIYGLKLKGTKRYYQDFTKVTIKKSELAFSFFKHIFLGEQIANEKEPNIIAHELVHIKQWHSLDLLFFEILRIAFWFNPLVYIYQSRVSELHEFIADSVVAKTNKKEQYQLLLAEVFQTQHISFVNQFFKKSLIKKRIVMLSKSKSKRIYQFKYLLLVPLVLGMLIYTSCEQEISTSITDNEVQSLSDIELINSIESQLEDKDRIELMQYASKFYTDEEILSKEDFFKLRISSKISIEKGFEHRPFKQVEDRRPVISYPSSQMYNNYVKMSEAFRVLDQNLKISIDKKEFTIRLLNTDTKDESIGSGEIIEIANVKDLTGEEIRKVNQTLERIKGSNRILILTDNAYSFLIKSNANTSNEEPISTNISNSESVPFAVVEEVPVFPGCEDTADKKACFQEKMKEHIRKNFRYPEEAQEFGIQGRVSTVFIIGADGNIKNVRMRGPDALLENEVLRIIDRLPQMTPGMFLFLSLSRWNGNMDVIKRFFSIPVNFSWLQNTSNTLNPFSTMALDHIRWNLTPGNRRIRVLSRYLRIGADENRERLLESFQSQKPHNSKIR